MGRGGRNWRREKRKDPSLTWMDYFSPLYGIYVGSWSGGGVGECGGELVVVGLDEWDMYDFLRLGEPTRFFFACFVAAIDLENLF